MGTVTRTALIALVATCVVLAASPVASASYRCDWGFGPLQFTCIGERGCAPGAGFTQQGAVFVGCAAWD